MACCTLQQLISVRLRIIAGQAFLAALSDDDRPIGPLTDMYTRLIRVRPRNIQHGQRLKQRRLRIGPYHHPRTVLLGEMNAQQSCQLRGAYTRRQDNEVTRQLALVRLYRSHPMCRVFQPKAPHLSLSPHCPASGLYLSKAGLNHPGRINLTVVGTQGSEHKATEL